MPLVVVSLDFFEAGEIAPRDLDATCFASYVQGLREAGWDRDERLVRLGFTTDAALRYNVGALRQAVPMVTDPSLQPEVEDLFGCSLSESVEGWVDLWPFQRGLIEEARALLPLVGKRAGAAWMPGREWRACSRLPIVPTIMSSNPGSGC